MSNLFNTKPLSDMSLEELKKQEQSFKTAGRVLTGFLLVLIVAYLIHLYRKDHSSGYAIPLAGLGGLSVFIADKLKKIRAEISLRG